MKGSKMAPVPTITTNLIGSAIECLANACQLTKQAESLNENTDGASTAYALAILAQEEAVKAFLLYLVSHEALPWNPFVRKSLRDHTSKQLWFVVLEALVADEEVHRTDLTFGHEFDADGQLLAKVADVLNWYRYAKIEAWNQGYCDWDEEPANSRVREIMEGKLDRRKQNALYVGIGATGKVTSRPDGLLTDDARQVIGVAEQFHSHVEDLVGIPGGYGRRQADWLKGLLKSIFVPPVRTGREIHDHIPGVVFYEETRAVLQSPKP